MKKLKLNKSDLKIKTINGFQTMVFVVTTCILIIFIIMALINNKL